MDNIDEARSSTISEATANWIEHERSIPVEVAVSAGLTTIKGFPAFEFRDAKGQLRYNKFRVIDRETGEKSFRRDRSGTETCLFGEDQIALDPDLSSPLVWTEGEIDRLSCLAAAVPNVVSVPDGAQHDRIGEGAIDPSNDRSFGWMWFEGEGLKPHIDQFARHVLAVDGDKKGRVLREELAVRIGRARCWYVEWPEECKDANDVLRKHGAQALNALIAAAKPLVPNMTVPITDVVDPSSGEIFQTGIQMLDEGLKVSFMPPELVVITGKPGSGKALALDTEVPTPSGWTTMGGIAIGDTVYGVDGNPCVVTNATDVMLGHECFEVVFSDGAKIVADADHQWLTSTDAARKKRMPQAVVTTRQIAATLKRADGGSNHAIELCAPVQGVASILSIDPYVLGAWLGNGRNADGGVCLYEEAQADEFLKAAGGGDVRTWSDGSTRSIIGLKVQLGGLGLLHNKHIPPAYLRASADQRIALLQGLMDTDGYCAPESRLCEFCSVTEALARDTWELACSLGLKATLSTGRATLNGRDCGPKYRVMFTAPDFPVFRLARKAVNQKVGTANRTGRRYIVGCTPVASVPVRCIAVDSPDHMFLVTRNHIATHNSEFATILGCNLANFSGAKGAILQFEDRATRVRDTVVRYALNNVPGITLRSEAFEWAGKWIRAIEPEQSLDAPARNLKWLTEVITEARQRHNCRWVVMDPW
nr:toprim domain-containing protein [Gemmatimonadaceae bacterium]